MSQKKNKKKNNAWLRAKVALKSSPTTKKINAEPEVKPQAESKENRA